MSRSQKEMITLKNNKGNLHVYYLFKRLTQKWFFGIFSLQKEKTELFSDIDILGDFWKNKRILNFPVYLKNAVLSV